MYNRDLRVQRTPDYSPGVTPLDSPWGGTPLQSPGDGTPYGEEGGDKGFSLPRRSGIDSSQGSGIVVCILLVLGVLVIIGVVLFLLQKSPPEDIEPDQGKGAEPNQDTKTGSSKETEIKPPHAEATEDATPEQPTPPPTNVPPNTPDKSTTLTKISSPKETEPTTTTKATTPYKTTQRTDPAKTEPPSLYPEAPLVCSVSVKFSAAVSLPTDGVCKFLFFDSLYKDNLNSLTASNAFQGNVQEFLLRAQRHAKTEFGMSLSLEFANVHKQSKTPPFRNGLDYLWGQGIRHYGILNLYESYATHKYIRSGGAVKVLKEIVQHLRKKDAGASTPQTALGLAPIDAVESRKIARLVAKAQLPSLLISLGHISYADNDRPNCRILPPTVFSFPENAKEYGHTLADAIQHLKAFSTLKGHKLSLALALTLQGRLYKPSNPDSNTQKIGNFDVFKPCQQTTDDMLVVPASVCDKSGSSLQQHYMYNAELYTALTYDKTAIQTMTFDSSQALQSKACDSKRFRVEFQYALAAYDIDYDAWPKACTSLSLQGQFLRLRLLKRLNNFIYHNFTSYLNRTACTSIPF